MKRVLVISNNCFSKENSNGRTLGNLLYRYPKDKLAQFYISGDPDDSYCSNYFQVTDAMALHRLCPWAGRRKSGAETDTSGTPGTPDRPVNRNSATMILRNFVWNTGAWKTRGFRDWLDAFQPEIVLLQVGDCAFMNRLACRIAKKYGATLDVFNTETYYLKDFNYFRDGHRFLFGLFKRSYNRSYRKLMKQTTKVFHLCDAIKDAYRDMFDTEDFVVYNSSDLRLPLRTQANPRLVYAYIGNLNLGRDDSIMDIADVLQSTDSRATVRVYGKASDQTRDKFRLRANVDYRGFIGYQDVVEAIREADVLIHVESFDDFYRVDSRYGFSGKIADCLFSGRPLLLYAPSGIAVYQYLQANHIGTLASDKDELQAGISALSDDGYRRKAALDQEIIAAKNHDRERNSDFFMREIGT